MFIIATYFITSKKASDPRIRLKSLILYLIGSCCLIVFSMLLMFSFGDFTGFGIITAQSYIAIRDVKGIINCKKEIKILNAVEELKVKNN